jgi:hypothetical protein
MKNILFKSFIGCQFGNLLVIPAFLTLRYSTTTPKGLALLKNGLKIIARCKILLVSHTTYETVVNEIVEMII